MPGFGGLRGPGSIRVRIEKFRQEQDGAVLPLTIVLFLMMVVATGMAVDYMRHETYRAELQNAIDRGLLAAADLDQELDPEDTLRSFFATAEWFGKDVAANPEVAGIHEVALEVDVEENSIQESGNTGDRRISATASYEFNTFFLRLIGYPTLTVQVAGTAEERRRDVELSLVLDISGTMRYCSVSGQSNCQNNSERRISRLVTAANEFIDTMVDNDTAGTVSMNIVPYAGQVNPGPALFAALGGQRDQYIDTKGTTGTERYVSDDTTVNFGTIDPENLPANVVRAPSSCMDLPASAFTNTGLPGGSSYTQTTHFHNWGIDNENFWGIDPLTGESFAGTKRRGLWMNWGWCPQDDTAAITLMENDPGVLKEAIDRLQYGLHDGTGTDIGMKWGLALLDPGSRDTLEPFINNPDYKGERPRDWDDLTTLKVIVLMTDGQITEQRRPDNRFRASNARIEGSTSQTVSGNTAKDQFEAICELARDNNVIVFTIAFEAPSGVKQAMRDCAYDPDTHFFDVVGTDISVAFRDISTTLQKIKLVR